VPPIAQHGAWGFLIEGTESQPTQPVPILSRNGQEMVSDSPCLLLACACMCDPADECAGTQRASE
jgi:hypothetical protein